jgi:hypothetical protein
MNGTLTWKTLLRFGLSIICLLRILDAQQYGTLFLCIFTVSRLQEAV